MAIRSLLAMFVLSPSAGLAMSMKERMEISLALSARPGTRGTKVSEDKIVGYQYICKKKSEGKIFICLRKFI